MYIDLIGMEDNDMRMKTAIACLCFCFLFLMGTTRLSYGDSAEVLPKGVFRGDVEYSYYLPVDEKFDPDGNEEDLAADYNTSLNSNVFPDLSLVELGFGMPAGSASLGDSVIDFEYDFDDLILKFFYGVTDKLSIGTKIPYYWQKNNVNATLDTTNATVGKNPFVPGEVAPIYVPGTTVPFPGTVPFTTNDIQNFLVQAYGYKPVETWSGSGIGDIEVGGRYQYLKTENWRLAFTGGVRLPTGEVDDPDNLVDIAFGSGAWALLFRANNDYTGIENVILNASFEYDLVLPDHETLRVPDDVNRPLTTNKENVDRDLGDIFKLKLSGAYAFYEGFGLSLLYSYAFQTKDRISGDQGYNYESLEDETDWTYHEYKVGLSYSTIPLFQKKKFPLPLVVGIEYEDVFAGSNNFLKQQLITFSLSAFF
jgi:hypothetical protein